MKLRLIIILAYVLLLSFSAVAQTAYDQKVEAKKFKENLAATNPYLIGTDAEGYEYQVRLIKTDGLWRVALISDRAQECDSQATLRFFTMDGNQVFLIESKSQRCVDNKYDLYFNFMGLDGEAVYSRSKSEEFVQELISSGMKGAQLVVPGEFIDIETNEFGIYFFRKGYVAVNDMLTDPMDKAIDGAINLLKSFKD